MCKPFLARERISKYKITLDIIKTIKNKMIEVFTKLKYTDVEEKKKAFFELLFFNCRRNETQKKKEMENLYFVIYN